MRWTNFATAKLRGHGPTTALAWPARILARVLCLSVFWSGATAEPDAGEAKGVSAQGLPSGPLAAPASTVRHAGESDDDELALLFAACHPALTPPS
jgi:hypothetical protein